MSEPTVLHRVSGGNGAGMQNDPMQRPEPPPFSQPDSIEARVASVLTLADRLRQRHLLEEAGFPFYLHHSGFEAKVRRLSLADQEMLGTLPPHLQQQWSRALNDNTKTPEKNRTFQDYVRAAESDERIANVACVAGFLWPRLTLTEAEADTANDPDNVIWVGLINIYDRKAYMRLCIGNATEEELRRIAGFLDSRLEDPGLG